MVHTAFHSHRIHVIKCLRILSLPYKLIVFLAISNAQLEIEIKKSRNMNPLTVFLLCLFGVYSGRFTHPLIVSFCVSLEVIQIGLSIIKILIIYEQYNYLRLKNNQIWKNYIFYSLHFSTQEFFLSQSKLTAVWTFVLFMNYIYHSSKFKNTS